MTRTHILNYLAEQRGLRRYLEIGVQNVRNNFNKIKCPYKLGVDPEVDHIDVMRMTSDQFFDINKGKFDLIFIDGLHEYEQVKKDFENSLKALNPGGLIMFHDTLPNKEINATVPRQTREWYGDVYRLILELAGMPDIKYVTVDIDCGCTIAWRGSKPEKTYPLTWQSYMENRKAFNIIAPHELQNHF